MFPKRKCPVDATPIMRPAPNLDESWPPAFEPFVDADTIAKLLMVKRKTVLDWARRHVISAHPFGQGKRVVWRFRLSEIASWHWQS